MKIGYGVYGMKSIDIFEALPRLREIGYEMVELCAASGWGAEPAQLSARDRARLTHRIRECEFGTPVLMAMISPCCGGPERESMLKEFLDICQLAEELNETTDPAIVTSTLGGYQPDWESGKTAMASRLSELGDIAVRRRVIFAIEPHIGGALDSPEKAQWLMQYLNHPNVKLNFDYSHFYVQGRELSECISLCLPYSVHTHIKDGRMRNGVVEFMLPGDGALRLTGYFDAMNRAGSQLPICVEVSGMVWRSADYDPWSAAIRCFGALDRARSAACSTKSSA